MKKDQYQMDMTHGPLLGKILIFSIPLMFSGVLQLLFNAADVIVVGQFCWATFYCGSRFYIFCCQSISEFIYWFIRWGQCTSCTFYCLTKRQRYP